MGLLQLLDGEAVPLAVLQVVASLICRGEVEGGGDHTMEGHTAILRHIILVGGEVYLRLCPEDECEVPRRIVLTLEDTPTDRLDSGEAEVGEADEVYSALAIEG